MFQKGYFSVLLNISKIIQVFKKGDRRLLQHYFPNFTSTGFSKMLESVFQESEGFRKGLSTNHTFIHLVDKPIKDFRFKDYMGIVSCDLTKTFDCDL